MNGILAYVIFTLFITVIIVIALYVASDHIKSSLDAYIKGHVEYIKEQVESQKNFNKQIEEINGVKKVSIGDRAIYATSLVHPDAGSYTATYEIEIIECSADRVRCLPISVHTTTSKSSTTDMVDANMRYLKDRWVLKKDIDLIISDSMQRTIKLNQILNDK